jgi:hypothetical protein
MASALPVSSGVSAVRPARPFSRRLQLLVAAVLAALVLIGGVELHPAAESREPLAALASPRHQDTYFPAASHPVQPPHAETAKAELHPFCAICFSRSQGNGARLAAAARISASLAGSPLTAAVAASPLQRSLRPDGARAPPAA